MIHQHGAVVQPRSGPAISELAVAALRGATQAFAEAQLEVIDDEQVRFTLRVYDVDGQACPRCAGRLRPFGAVLPAHSAEFVPVESTGPPSRQESLIFAS
jgi:hypothetical protein